MRSTTSLGKVLRLQFPAWCKILVLTKEKLAGVSSQNDRMRLRRFASHFGSFYIQARQKDWEEEEYKLANGGIAVEPDAASKVPSLINAKKDKDKLKE